MKILPSSPRCPWPYAGSALQGPPSENSFLELTHRVAAFSRDGMLGMGSRMLWYVWQHDEVASDGSQATMVTRASAPQVTALGLIYGSTGPGAAQPTELDFRLLCWEFHNLPKEFGLDAPESIAEVGKVQSALASVSPESRLAVIGAGRATEVRGLFRLGRSLAAYLDRIRVRITDLARVAAVLREMESLVSPDAFRRGERAFLRTSTRLFVRATGALLGMASSDALGEIVPGRVDFAEGEKRPELPPDVGVDDFLILSNALGTAASEYRNWGDELRAMPSQRAASHPRLDNFRHRPIVLMDHYRGDDFAVAIPSPWNLVSAAMRLLSQEFVESLAENGIELGITCDVPGAFGTAFEKYLEQSLACRPDVKRIPASTTRTPDFIWPGETYGVLIEAKVRVTPASDPHRDSATSILVTWQRLCAAMEQAQGLVDATPKAERCERYVLVVVVNEPDAAGFSGFRHAAGRFGLLTGTDLVGVAVWSPAELEEVVLTRTPDEAGKEIERRFLESSIDALAQPSEAPDGEGAITPLVASAWCELFPETPLGAVAGDTTE